MTVRDENCADCGADLTDGEYSRVIGVEIQGVYDGVLYWVCPDCGFAWPRIFGYGYLDQQSKDAVLVHNQRRGVQETLQEPTDGPLSP